MTHHEAVARLENVSVTYGSGPAQVHALRDCSLSLATASTYAVVGRSGCGKSTMISLLALMRRPTSGDVWVGGARTSELTVGQMAVLRARTTGIVFQSFHLDPALTALENIMLPHFFTSTGLSHRQAKRSAGTLLDDLEIADLAQRKPPAMSGGQRQRIAIARAMFCRPALLVADEPTGNLDEDTANLVADLLFGLPRRYGTTVLVVTHDNQVAERAQTRLHLAHGILSEQSSPAVVTHGGGMS